MTRIIPESPSVPPAPQKTVFGTVLRILFRPAFVIAVARQPLPGDRLMSEEIFVSTDVEADGPIPGPHSMLSFASAAYTPDKQLIATFSANRPSASGFIACSSHILPK